MRGGRGRQLTALAMVPLLLAASGAGAQETATGEGAAASPGPWRVRTYGGVSTLRTGSFEVLPNSYWDVRQANWKLNLGMDMASRSHEGADVAFVSGIEAGYQVDPLVCAAVRVGQFISASGISRAIVEGGGMRTEDTWEYSTDMATVAAGVVLALPLGPRLRLNGDLFLGTGLATIHIQHRAVNTSASGSPTVQEAAADAGGTAFLPEFGLELEYELSPSLAAGAGLAYRFGGVDEYRHKHESSLDTFATSVEGRKDFPLRDLNRNVVAGDYGGAVLTLLLTARL